jgi:hypothetical protein
MKWVRGAVQSGNATEPAGRLVLEVVAGGEAAALAGDDGDLPWGVGMCHYRPI